ncbi:DUF6728 family protein [Chitinophaga silvatica]|uniref:DUF6728 family protein n=1 Tax=Chitinophaga silvatica TaxID=2282649 RepID=UPI00293920D6|nr:DUF6728 family protein [Chitinophaga silvatica]
MKSIFKQILRYFYIGKKDPNAPKSTYLSMMHGMNRISIILFLLALILMLVRFIKHH